MRPTEIPEIRALALFRDMSDDQFEALMRAAYVQTLPPGIELFHEGDRPDFLHVVVEGSVELFAEWSGHETTMQIVQPVATIILAATLRDAPFLMSARTLERSHIVLVPSDDVRQVFASDGAFARAVVGELAGCYRSMVKAQKDLKLRSSTERLANWILRQDGIADRAGPITIDLEKRKLASLLGMTPENLSRALNRLADHGVVVEGKELQASDLPALRRFARPTPLIDQHDI
ncbi:MAG: helix-turn-helix domain-containing protein [Rhodobacteraceae bacterium]|nr:helix-turn-helix domain-containing protein [Paracoccaceae bacterium]